jgi:hypothetical protein
MGLESVTGIWDLNASNPAPGDNKAEGDDHLRNLKKAIKATFPNINKQVTKSADNLNADNRVKNAPYEQIASPGAPMLEYHRQGQVAFSTLIGSDNRWYLHGSNGAGGLTTPHFSVGPGADAYFNGPITVNGSVAATYMHLHAANGVSLTMAINGYADRNFFRDPSAMGFLGLDGAWNMFSHNNGDLWVRGNISGFSDERYKRDWRGITQATLNAFAKMKLVGTYENTKTNERMAGVSAQELRKILPEVVTDHEDLLGVVYGNAALVLLHKAMERILLLEEEVAQIRGRV